MFNHFDRGAGDRALTDLTGLSEPIFSKPIHPKDRNAVRLLHVAALEDSIDLRVNEDPMILSNLLCQLCLIRMRLYVGILPNRKNIPVLIIDDSGDILQHEELYHAGDIQKTDYASRMV